MFIANLGLTTEWTMWNLSTIAGAVPGEAGITLRSIPAYGLQIYGNSLGDDMLIFMRFKLISIFLVVFMMPICSFAEKMLPPELLSTEVLRSTLSSEDLQLIRFPKQTIDSPYGKFLIITHNYAPNFASHVLAEAYVYILKDDTSWGLIAYIRTDTSKLEGEINKDMFSIIVKGYRNAAMSIPLSLKSMQLIRSSTATNASSLMKLSRTMMEQDNSEVLPSYILTRKIIESTYGSFLIIASRSSFDPACGEVYIYRSTTPINWKFFAYIKSDDPKLSVLFEKEALIVVKESGDTAASILLGANYGN